MVEKRGSVADLKGKVYKEKRSSILDIKSSIKPADQKETKKKVETTKIVPEKAKELNDKQVHPSDAAIIDRIETLFYELDAKYLQKYPKNSIVCGTTIAIILIFEDRIISAWLGDCQSFLVMKPSNASGKKSQQQVLIVKPLTEDHVPSRPDEVNRIARVGGEVIQNRINVTNGSYPLISFMTDMLSHTERGQWRSLGVWANLSSRTSQNSSRKAARRTRKMGSKCNRRA